MRSTSLLSIACLLLTALSACSAGSDNTQRRIARPTETLRAMTSGRAPTPNTECRKHLRAAQQGFAARRRALVQRFLVDLEGQGLDPQRPATATSIRRIAAGLFALREERVHAAQNPGAPRLYNPSVPNDFPAQVEAFTAKLEPSGVPGTSAGLGAPHGDYDFVMKELVSLLYVFRDEPALLTTDAAYNIVSLALLPRAHGTAQEHLTFDIRVPLLSDALRYPETENHVLMTLSSIYLTRQWIAQNPRKDARLNKSVRSMSAALDVSDLVDPLLQASGRALHNGFFEVNARPYQAMSAHALLNLQAFAADPAVRIGARNAFDYLATVFAFQSLEAKRYGPYRRSAGYADRVGMYENDGMLFMMGALSGSGSWPETFYSGGNTSGHALWATLLDYHLPDAVQELMLHKHSGYWARMHSRYGSSHYQAGSAGRYFDSDGRAHESADIAALPELYFATSRFLNAAGGHFRRMPIRGDALNPKHGVQDLDFLSRPHALLTLGHLHNWQDLNAMAEEVMLMSGDRRFWQSDNSATYKSFSYGYRELPGRDAHLRFPMRMPLAWQEHIYREGARADWSLGNGSRVRFRFVDLSDVEPYGFYVVLGQVSKSERDPRHREISRGFWEIVPKERFKSARELKDATLAHNDASQFSNALDGNARFYRYRMTTDELVELDPELGYASLECRNPIRRIWAKGDDPSVAPPLPLADYAFDRCDPDAIARAPLVDVREVDDAYQFTGRRLAYAGGDGQLLVDNPYIGATLWLDSSEYRRPVRTAGDLPALPQ